MINNKQRSVVVDPVNEDLDPLYDDDRHVSVISNMSSSQY